MSLQFNWLRAATVAAFSLAAGQASSAQILETRAQRVIANVVETKGEEDFTPVELPTWRDLVTDQDLSAGDLLRTGAFGGLGIAFEDRTYVRLHANTQMAVDDPGSETTPRRFDLRLGRLWSRASRPDRPVIVDTPSATAAIRGTDWFMEVLANGTSRLTVLDGEVRFFNDLGELDVAAGQSAVARPGLAPEFELEIAPADRPRWALTPRSDWIDFLPMAAVAEDEAGSTLAPVWLALAAVRPRLAATRLAETDKAGGDDAELARALIDLMQRDPVSASERLDGLSLSGELARLGETAAIGAAIDSANFADALKRLAAYDGARGADLSSIALRAYLEAYAGRYDAATELAGAAAATAPGDWRHHLLTAQVAALTADDETFATSSAAMVRLAPGAASAWHWRGIYLAAAGGAEPARVKAAFERAVALNPERVVSIVAVAGLQAAAGQYTGALDGYERALLLNAGEPYAIAGKAFVHLNMDRLDLADAILAPLEDTPLALHPEIRAAQAVRDLMAGKADRASEATGQVIAANPDRPGATQNDAIAQWQAGRHAVAQDVIENAVRLDPNEPVSARIASAMAQDQYRARAALDFARAAWEAGRRNAEAGLIQLPASQSGRIDIGAPFQYAGLPAQGAYYSSLARSQSDANSAFGYAQLYPDPLARQSSTSLGLMLDPLSVTYPNRFATFFRAPHTQQTVDLSAVLGSDDVSGLVASSDAQALIRTPRQPIALAGFVSLADEDGPADRDSAQSALLSLRGGTVLNGQHGLVGRLTVDYRDRELPGSFGVPDSDDEEETVNTVFGLGYSYRESWTDRWMLRATGGTGKRTFRNPSAFGSGVDPLDYSLAVSLGLATAQELAARGIFDTPFSAPGEAILAVEPPEGLDTTGRVGTTLLPLTDDDDPVRRIEADVTLLSLQTRRILERGTAEYSLGLEYGLIDNDSHISEFVFTPTGAGAFVDFGRDGAVTAFDLGMPLDLAHGASSRTKAWQAHAIASWQPAAGWTAEAGVFPTLVQSRFRSAFLDGDLSDNHRSLDPRIGLAWQGDRTQLRLVLQRTRRLPGVDTIAPIGTLGLLPTQDLGIGAERIDSAIFRVEHEARDDVFLHLTAEHQDMQTVSAGLAGERLEQAAFFATDARLDRIAAGADVFLGDRLGVSASYAWSDGELEDALFEGAELPVVPEHQASVSATWVDPRFFRASGRLAYVGERFADAPNRVRLDDALVLSARLARETRDKRWLFRLEGQATWSDDSPASLGQPATDSRITLGLSRRW